MVRCGAARTNAAVFACVFAGCGCQPVHLGGGDDDDDDDEGCAVGAPLYPIVNHSRVVREL